jgi:exosortase
LYKGQNPPTANVFSVSPERGEQQSSSEIGMGTSLGVWLCFLLMCWTYWPTFIELIATWSNQPDYAHGFVVLPLAIFFLYARRDSFPGFSQRVGWAGLTLVLASIGLRIAGERYFLFPLDGWSMIVWTAGATWLLAGSNVLRWILPVILFLVFMVPLPHRMELQMSLPLQSVATQFSAWTLQLLGEPAIAEGNTIYLPAWSTDPSLPGNASHSLEVARACSGLRIFMTSIAMGSGWAIITRSNWLDTVLILFAAVPIAIVANVLRIVMTALMYRHGSAHLSASTIHDVPGWFMVPLTALMFGVLVWYLKRLIPTVSLFTVSSALRHANKEQ